MGLVSIDTGAISLPAGSNNNLVSIQEFPASMPPQKIRLQFKVGSDSTLDAIQLQGFGIPTETNRIEQADLSTYQDFTSGTVLCPAAIGLSAIPVPANSTFALIVDTRYYPAGLSIMAGSVAGTTLQMQSCYLA